MAESEVVGAKMMRDYANFINTGHRNFIRVLIPHQILRKIRIYVFLWHPMSSSMQLWNVSPPEYLISRSKDFKTIGRDALIRPATHGGLLVGWKKSGWTDHWNSWVPMAIFLLRSSSYDEFSLITPAQRGQDKILRSPQVSQDKNVGFNISATISGVTSGDNLPATFNGSQPTQPGRGGGSGGPRHSHLARPASQPSQGVAGARSRQGDNGAMANMAGIQCTINGSSMARWDEVAERMILITLPAKGRPYKRVDIENAIISTGFPPDGMETLGNMNVIINGNWLCIPGPWHMTWFAACPTLLWIMTRGALSALWPPSNPGSIGFGSFGTWMRDPRGTWPCIFSGGGQ